MIPAETSAVFAVLQQGLAKRLRLSAEDITASSRLTEDLGVDSLTAVELLIEVEDRFGVIVTDADAGRLSTVGEAAELIAGRMSPCDRCADEQRT
jgi:acyl carrier protein